MKYTTLTPEIEAALECAKAQYLAAKPDRHGQYAYRANPKQLEELFTAMKLAGAKVDSSNNSHLNNGYLDLTVIGPSSSKERYATIYFNLRYLQELVTDFGTCGFMAHPPLTTFIESINIMLGLAEFDTEAVKQMKIEKITEACRVLTERRDKWQEVLYGETVAA